ncbi:unnamed protein product, partial [Discosporangium mesarthrocarpum]
TLQSLAADTNSDSLTDHLLVNVNMPLVEGEEIFSIKMLVFFRVRLRDRAKVEMDAMTFLDHGGGVPGASLQAEGDVRIRQAWPLSVYGGYRYPYSEDQLLELTTLTSAGQARIASLLSKYSARNREAF